MKTFLYATDRPGQAVPALRYAQDQQNRLGANLIMFQLHVIPHIRAIVTRVLNQIELHIIDVQKEILFAYGAHHFGNSIEDEEKGFLRNLFNKSLARKPHTQIRIPLSSFVNTI